jgi:trigger factor
MQVTTTHIDKTNVALNIIGEKDELANIKKHVLQDLAKSRGNVAGFRKGKAPLALIEKQLEPSLVQSEFLEHAVNDLYIKAAQREKIRSVSQPKIDIKKYVPYDTLEFTATLEVIGDVTLADYKKIPVTKKKAVVTAKDVDEVLGRLKTREAEKKDVDRPAKEGDEVLIDFKGVDAKTKEPVAGADGSDYPLVIGSNTFIPGFEPQLVGMKIRDQKTFEITFPADYGVPALQSKVVEFKVTVHNIQELSEPKLDDAFAAKVGPFKDLSELKADIKKQILQEREQTAEREYENELITKIAEKTEVALPESLIDQEISRMEEEERRNLVYRGQTWQEHLAAEGVTEEQHHENNREQATLRVKAGLVLSEIAEAEKIDVTQEEFDMHYQMLRTQYTDPQMLAELDRQENQRDLLSRILTQKAVAKVKEYNASNAPKEKS